MIRKNFLFYIAVGLLLAACGGRVSASAPGDAARGKALFNQVSIGPAPGCATCHSLEPGKVIVGPSLAGVARRAGERIPGVSAVDYLRSSILDPNSYVVEGFPAGVMFQSFMEVLTEEQINDLVAYLLTLR